MKNDRYYVQSLTEQIFIVRKCLSVDGKPGPDDSIVKSFEARYDAYSYASTMNDGQSKLDTTATSERVVPSEG